MIDAEEKEEIQQKEQKMQLPLRDIDETWNRLPAPNEALPRLSKAKMSYPLGKPNFPEQMQDPYSETDYQTIGATKYKIHATKTKTNVTSAKMINMIKDLENKKDIPEEKDMGLSRQF